MKNNSVDPRTYPIQASMFDGTSDTDPLKYTGTLADLFGERHRLVKCNRSSIEKVKRRLGVYSMAVFRPGGSRRDEDVESVEAVTLDFDSLTRKEWCQVKKRARKYAHAYATTFRHRLGGPDSNHFRITFVLEARVSGQQYPTLFDAIRTGLFDGLGDGSVRNASRVFYELACPKFLARHAEITFHSGPVLSPETVLKAYVRAKAAPEGVAPRDGSSPVADIADAIEAWNRDNARPWPKSSGRCPACGHNGCFNRMPYDPLRWACFSDRHGVDSDGCGQHGEGCWYGDTLDLVAKERGISRHEVLKADGYLKAASPLRELQASEVELARKLLAGLRTGSTEAVACDGSMCVYGPGAGMWRNVPIEELKGTVQKFEGCEVAKTGGGTTRLRMGRRLRDGIIDCAMVEATNNEFFANPTQGFAFSNGFVLVSADGLKLVPHDPDHRARAAFPFPFDVNAKAARFKLFLREIFQLDDPDDARAKRILLKEFIGACLVQCATDKGKCLFLEGSGNNGKSVFIDIILELFPKDSWVAISPQDLDDRRNRAALAGKLLNVVADIPARDMLSTDHFKSIMTGDPVSGCHVYDRPFTFKPIAGHIFSANELPGTVDQTWGFRRRITVVEFNRKFTEEDAESRRELVAALNAELPGIALWALKGAVRALKNKDYTEPPSTVKRLKSWLEEADLVSAFLANLTEPKGRTPADVLYQRFKRWAEDTGHEGISQTAFGKRMRALGFKSVRGKNCRYYPVTLKSQ